MDSLWKVWNNKSLPDTTQFSALEKIGFQLCFTNPDSGILISNMLIKAARDKGSKKWEGGGYNDLGNNYLSQANYQPSLDAFAHGMKLFEETGDKLHIANMYVNEGLVYEDMSDYPKSLECYQEAIKKYREMGDKADAEGEMGNVGIIYWYLNDYKKALEYAEEALKAYEAANDKLNIANTLSDMGLFYTKVPDYGKAMEYLNRAVDISREINNLQCLANTYGNISVVYGLQNDYARGIEYNMKCFGILKQIGDRNGMALTYINISSYYLKLKRIGEAEQYSDSASDLGKKIGALDIQRDAHLSLSDIYMADGRFKDALDQYKKYTQLKDSVINDSKKREIMHKEMQFEYDKKSITDSIKNAEAAKVKDLEIVAQKSEIKQQRTLQYALYGGLALVFVFSGFMYNRFRITRKQKVLIEKQKLEVEKQKLIVEEKNKDITDSINYASRIQRALLTTDDYISKRLKEYFILFKPRDIVSGDFYWANEVETNEGKRFLICAGDCTGHGVPGAFMSLLNISLLNEVNLEKKINEPAKILDEVREYIIKALNPEGKDDGSKDGMDCILCSFNLTDYMLDFACANNPLWLVRNNECIEYKADKMPVGIQQGHKPFSAQALKLQEGDMVYIFTDGFADQFGGPKGKKFKYKQLQEMLVSISAKPLNEQKAHIEKAFMDWKSDLEQIDDVLIIGIRG